MAVFDHVVYDDVVFDCDATAAVVSPHDVYGDAPRHLRGTYMHEVPASLTPKERAILNEQRRRDRLKAERQSQLEAARSAAALASAKKANADTYKRVTKFLRQYDRFEQLHQDLIKADEKRIEQDRITRLLQNKAALERLEQQVRQEMLLAQDDEDLITILALM